jgi:hypothetical protein
MLFIGLRASKSMWLFCCLFLDLGLCCQKQRKPLPNKAGAKKERLLLGILFVPLGAKLHANLYVNAAWEFELHQSVYGLGAIGVNVD